MQCLQRYFKSRKKGCLACRGAAPPFDLPGIKAHALYDEPCHAEGSAHEGHSIEAVGMIGYPSYKIVE